MWLKIEVGMLEAGDFGVSDSESNPGSGPESGPGSEADFPFPTFSEVERAETAFRAGWSH